MPNGSEKRGLHSNHYYHGPFAIFAGPSASATRFSGYLSVKEQDMPKILDFDVSIYMDGVKMKEYKTEMDQSSKVPVVTCWVASEAGKPFYMDVVPPPGPASTNWSFKTKLDGRKAKVRNSNLKKERECDRLELREEYVDARTTAGFRFGTLQLVDDDTLLEIDSRDLGEIRLLIHTIVRFATSSKAPHELDSELRDARGDRLGSQVHERSKKAISHCVLEGDKHTLTTPQSWSRAVGEELAAEVVFKYRNLDVLVADGIAPRSALPLAQIPLPGPSGSTTTSSSRISRPIAGPSNPKKRKADPAVQVKKEVDEHKRLKLAEEAQKLEARLAAIRAEINDDAPVVKQEVKSEARPTFIPGEVIDLTLD